MKRIHCLYLSPPVQGILQYIIQKLSHKYITNTYGKNI